ncbi:SMODS domain-containing nucleotidyltransferase [Bradyrhizobium mercantei]|uniref:SMODS domain-containing nucleotidyltransferase n=1 Tax=Bradyrhizobium mercantei TaxID=1904807 RepID=UPI0009F8BB4F|nr:nucleotidyltransferase [Bradyrhizobium mercantei]
MPLPTDNPFNVLLSLSTASSSPLGSLYGASEQSANAGIFGSGLNGPFGLPAPTSHVNALTPFLTPPSIPPHLWFYVVRRFQRILNNIAITTAQREDGEKKHAGVRSALNRHYWNVASDTANSLLIGSWGKDTRVRPSRDVDILFLLPPSVYRQYQSRAGNRQSALLQEVKEVLRTTYSQTATLRADGQVVLLPFNTMPVEVAVGFRCTDGSIIYCDTNDGGSYKTSTAEAEVADLRTADLTCNANVLPLARLMKQWQRECNVPLKSFQIERLAVEFLRSWSYRHHSLFYYDWMVRDFLGFIIGRANTTLFMPGTFEAVPLGDAWLSRAQTAYKNAVSAADNEYGNYEAPAGQDWQKIFGAAAPVLVS